MSDKTDINRNHFDQFSHIYCISLKRSKNRREHIRKEFTRVGIKTYEFIDAYDKNSKEVTKLYHSSFVKKYPPCFRCGREICDCPNKSLFRPQIGNWLSHIEAWRNISRNQEGLSLVCEDDIKFQNNIYQSLATVAQAQEIHLKLTTAAPVLVRFGWARCKEHMLRRVTILTQDIRMANPCYAINSAMANLLLNSLEEISTTSDIYLHQLIGSTASHYTVIPPPVYELSFSTGEMISEIRPKERQVNFLMSKLETLDQDDPEYESIKAYYEKELIRLKQYQEYNESPMIDYEDKYDLI